MNEQKTNHHCRMDSSQGNIFYWPNISALDSAVDKTKLEELTVLKRSPDLLNNVKIGQDQLPLKVKHILFYGGCGHFGQVP